jgi:hypothetical protein
LVIPIFSNAVLALSIQLFAAAFIAAGERPEVTIQDGWVKAPSRLTAGDGR